MERDTYEQLLEKYKSKIKEEFGEGAVKPIPKVSTKEYSDFKKEIFPAHYSFYEKACNMSEKFLKLTADPKKAIIVQKDINACHLNITPSGVTSFSILLPLMVMFVGGFIGYLLGITVMGTPEVPGFFFIIFFLLAGLLLIPALQNVPKFMANTWRMKASNQMVQSIFYVVTYMRHTSNLERAIEFAADHLEPPLSLDFRKILWDVETEQFSNIRESADSYLTQWKEFNKDFVEAFHLVESSLYESMEDRRLALLDKSLDVILNGTYENMLHYAHNLQSPMTMLHMLGVILPILGLVILPLVVSFMGGGDGSNPLTSAVYISILYNVTLPASVFYLGKSILSKRPAGYGAIDISKKKGMKKFANVNINLGKKFVISVNPLYFAIMIFVVLFLIGISPLVMHTFNPDFEIPPPEPDGKNSAKFKLMEYICPPEKVGCESHERFGPYGIGASLLSLFVTISFGVSLGLFFSLRSKNVIKIRIRTKELEDEFSSALFQLGNRLGDGLPAEIAFSKVAETMEGTTSGDFFNLAERNMTKLGMGLEEAIFNPKVGAIANYPSKVIESSMKVLIESAKKGPRIAAQALLSMSRYIKEIHRVEERLKDLMSDIISSMKAQVKFLTPAIAGIVIGITSMISTILTKLSSQLTSFASSSSEGVGGWGEMLTIFGVGIPTFYFQVIVGLYIVQIAYILTVLANGIENGADKLGERYELGKSLISSVVLYCFIAGVVMLLFNLFAAGILSNSIGV
jgi:hypothetical protein